MTAPVPIGVLGLARIAERSVIPAIASLPQQFRLAGLASRSAEKARRFAEQFNAPAVDGYDALLGQPELQAVYIPLPNQLHEEWVEKALERGLHVLVEKPLACSEESVAR